MKKRLILILILVFTLAVVAVGIYLYSLPRDVIYIWGDRPDSSECSIYNLSACDRSCEIEENCKISACNCINEKEEVFVPENVKLLCTPVTCKCIGKVCTNIEPFP